MVTLVGFFFTETDILTTQGTQGPAACQWTRPSGRNWDPFVPGLLLTRTTGQSALTGKKLKTIDLSPLPSLSPLLNPSYPSLFF